MAHDTREQILKTGRICIARGGTRGMRMLDP